ncbi:MAG: ABC transporter permease [Velocimicrobium sp.]
MKITLEIAVKHIKYYKNKSFSILLSIVLAVSLIVGIGTLYNSAKHANVEKVRMENADYQFEFIVNQKQYRMITNSNSVEKIAATKYYDSAIEPNVINIVQTNERYIDLFNSKILKGKMPNHKGEIALEEWVIQNLNIKPMIGEKVTFQLEQAKKSETFQLVGILKDIPKNKKNQIMEGYIDLNENAEQLRVYIKFYEQLDIKKQMNVLKEKMKDEQKDIRVNRELLEAMNVFTYVPSMGSKGSIRYIIAKYHFDLIGIIFIISVFSAFVINSVFFISTLQRISEYGLIEALGADNLSIFTILFSELILLFAIGFPIGTITGILGAKLLNKGFSSVLIGEVVKTEKIYISTISILSGGLFLLLLFFFIAIGMLKTLNKLTPIEAIQKQYGLKSINSRSKRLYTLKKGSITNAISFKYMTRKKSAFIGILLSLSLGGAIFICSDYAADLTKENNELQIKANNDLNSDYQIGMQLSDFDDGITNNQIKKLKNISGVDMVSPISYYFGSIVINDDHMISKVMWDSCNKIPYIENSFGGIYKKINDSSNNYLLRTGIYGYDDHMLQVLKDYIVEGEIDIDKMKQSNLILFKQIQDGGNGLYDLIDVKPGDTITITYQKSPKISEEALKFKDGSEYVEKNYVVAATLKRVAASNEYFIGDDGEDIIMTNSQFQKDFGVNTYNMVSITKKEEADHVAVAKKINHVVKDTLRCSVTDLTVEIAEHNAFVNKQLMFLYGVTGILFIISLFNILNNIGYNVLSRMNEFGVLRAMGITNEGFFKMIIWEGLLYGMFAGAFTVIASLLGQAAVLFIVKIGYLYIAPHFTINAGKYFIIILLTITIAMIATILPSLKIIKMSIVEEIRRQE